MMAKQWFVMLINGWYGSIWYSMTWLFEEQPLSSKPKVAFNHWRGWTCQLRSPSCNQSYIAVLGVELVVPLHPIRRIREAHSTRLLAARNELLLWKDQLEPECAAVHLAATPLRGTWWWAAPRSWPGHNRIKLPTTSMVPSRDDFNELRECWTAGLCPGCLFRWGLVNEDQWISMVLPNM